MKSYKNKKSDQPQADNSHMNVTNEDDTVTPKAPLSKSSDQDKASQHLCSPWVALVLVLSSRAVVEPTAISALSLA